MRLEELLLTDFNVYRAQTRYMHDLIEKGVPLTPLKTTPERLRLLTDMVVFCRLHEVEPRQWLFMLFKARGWNFPVKFQKGSLLSANMLTRYSNMRGLGFFKKRVHDSKGRRGYDPNVDINATVEALKVRYATSAQADRCLDEIFTTTLGWHPDSTSCGVCVHAVRCAQKIQSYVPFDIIGLRLGTQTPNQAEAAANG